MQFQISHGLSNDGLDLLMRSMKGPKFDVRQVQRIKTPYHYITILWNASKMLSLDQEMLVKGI